MNNNKIKSQIFKTEDFYVENRYEKKMHLLRKSELIFNKIANTIELQNKHKKQEIFKIERSQNQRETRIAKRTYYYEFYLFETDYNYKIIDKEQVSIDLNLKKNDFSLNENYVGIFKGSEQTLKEFLDSLYE